MDAFTPDFLNLELWNEEIGRMLSPSPHELKDIFGNQLSAKGADQAGAAETEISVRGKIVAKLRSPHSQQIRPLLEGALESRLCSLQAENEREINQLLVQDLDMLLDLSEIETMPIEETLQHLLRILRRC